MRRSAKAAVPRHRYSDKDLVDAVRLVKEDEKTLHYAATVTGVPISTIYRHSKSTPNAVPGRPTFLTHFEEQSLVDYILKMSDVGLGLTKADACQLILDIVADGRRHPWAHSPPGRDFWEGFMRRHPEVSMRSNEKLVKQRAQMDNPAILGDYMDKLEAVMKLHNFEPSNIYNVDETKVEMRPLRTFARRGSKTVYSLAEAPLPHITVVGCVNGDGTHLLPPLIIHKGANILESWTGDPDEIEGTFFGATDNGWIDRNVFEAWLDRFIAAVAGRRGLLADGTPKPVLLIFDGHESHIALASVLKAEAAGVQLFQLPAHTSHRTQPLDVACFQSWHRNFAKVVHQEILRNPRRTITRARFAGLMKPAWLQGLSGDNARAGFRKAGIVPFDRSRLLDAVHGIRPADIMDPRPNRLLASPDAPTPPPLQLRLTPLQSLKRQRRDDLADLVNDHELRIAELEQELAHLKEVRIRDKLRLPFADETNSMPAKKRRVSATGTDGKARLLTSAEIQKALEDAKTAKAERAEAAKADKRAKAAAARALKLSKPAGVEAPRRPGRPPKARAPTALGAHVNI